MRAYTNYGGRAAAPTPQSQPIPGREAEMEPNNAGGVTFKLDDWERLNRFLIIGSEGGTYYVGELDLTKQNADAAIRCIKADGERAVGMASDININNRAPKTDQQLFLLALAMKHGDENTKAAVYHAAAHMLRTGTHLLHFVAMLDSLGGWNRSKRRLVAKWFEDREPDKLAYQVLKYQQRDGWSMRDVLRVAHPKAATEAHRAVYQWLCKRLGEPGTEFPAILQAHAAMVELGIAERTPAQQALFGIEHGLPREALPTEALNDEAVWRALLPQTPPHALLRNLGNLTSSGMLQKQGDLRAILAKLTDREALVKARVHPFAVLLAALVYKGGKGIRGGKTWTPLREVTEALDDAYEAAFASVRPTGKRILVAIDISGSMSASCVGTPIPSSTAAAAMALTLARTEPNATVVQFDTGVQRVVPITKRSALSSLERRHGGGTDLTAAVRWALEKGEKFDAFVILTDNETWAGRGHSTQLLAKYQRAVNPSAKLVCCAMAANHANVVDPQDPLQFGCAGLDASLPALVSEFIRR